MDRITESLSATRQGIPRQRDDNLKVGRWV